MNAAAPARALRRPRVIRLRRALLRPRLLAALALALALLIGAWLWVRDSSLVSVKRVTVVGVTGPDGPAVRAALVAAARNMTTLDVDMGELHMAVQPFPEVRQLRVSTHFPHGLRIDVVEQVPVAVATVAGRRIAVAADGTLLRGVQPSGSLPEIPLRVPPGGGRITDRPGRQAVAVLSAAPWQLLGRIAEVTTQAGHGVVAQLRNGPTLYFGGDGRLAAKWDAAIAVLADPGSANAAYVDVSDPQRPVAGAGITSAAAAGAGITSAAHGPTVSGG